MSVNKFNITDTEIEELEKFLLPEKCNFDKERREFIRNFSTLDLQASPGSGKTTALLAKLILLDKRLPFENGSGLLILSHTNAAVNEIKNKLSIICSNIFKFPNYVGTIQSFVDDFLLKPYYNNKYKSKIISIDDDQYKFSSIVLTNDFSAETKKFLKIKLDKIQNIDNIPDYLKRLSFDEELNLVFKTSNRKFLNKSNNLKYSEISNYLKNDKIIIEKGHLKFIHAYNIAEEYINVVPKIKDILRNRFNYIFVDEMQDMSATQIKFLEKLFFNVQNDNLVYQRIGDKNQSIYSGLNQKDEDINEFWKDRDLILELKGSNRLTLKNAEVVKYFGISFTEISGNNIASDIRPHIILYDDTNCECKVINKFLEIIKNHQKEGKIPKKIKYPIKVIASRKEDNNKNTKNKNYTLKNYCPMFESQKVMPKYIYDNLESYFYYFDKNDKTLKSIANNIVNALSHLLYLEGIKYNGKHKFTKNTIYKFIFEKDHEKYKEYKLKLFNWSIKAIQNKADKIIDDAKTYYKGLIPFFDEMKICRESKKFIESKLVSDTSNLSLNQYECSKCLLNGIPVEKNSIHSVKGETHTATLYLETSYRKNTESSRLKEQFLKKKIKSKANKITKQSAKMVYVGFSRPTHLLCYATKKENFQNHLSTIDKNMWEIIDITDNNDKG